MIILVCVKNSVRAMKKCTYRLEGNYEVTDFRFPLKSRPFTNKSVFDHLKSGLFLISNLPCLQCQSCVQERTESCARNIGLLVKVRWA